MIEDEGVGGFEGWREPAEATAPPEAAAPTDARDATDATDEGTRIWWPSFDELVAIGAQFTEVSIERARALRTALRAEIDEVIAQLRVPGRAEFDDLVRRITEIERRIRAAEKDRGKKAKGEKKADKDEKKDKKKKGKGA